MSWIITIEPEATGWRWNARRDGERLTGWASGTRYNAECAARLKLDHEFGRTASKLARVET